MKVNSKKGGGIKSINGVIQEACKEKIERDRKRGILNRPVRAMVVGIPKGQLRLFLLGRSPEYLRGSYEGRGRSD